VKISFGYRNASSHGALSKLIIAQTLQMMLCF